MEQVQAADVTTPSGDANTQGNPPLSPPPSPPSPPQRVPSNATATESPSTANGTANKRSHSEAAADMAQEGKTDSVDEEQTPATEDRETATGNLADPTDSQESMNANTPDAESKQLESSPEAVPDIADLPKEGLPKSTDDLFKTKDSEKVMTMHPQLHLP